MQITDQTNVIPLIGDIDQFPSFDHLPQSIIHTDPYFYNVIQNGDKLSFIDLDDAGVAPALIDIGYVLAHCCTTTPSDRKELGVGGEGIIWHGEWAKSFLEGYQSQRPLTDEEKRLLEDAAKFGMLVYIVDWDDNTKLSDERFERYQTLSKNVSNLVKE